MLQAQRAQIIAHRVAHYDSVLMAVSKHFRLRLSKRELIRCKLFGPDPVYLRAKLGDG
jgi:hypothetical protein